MAGAAANTLIQTEFSKYFSEEDLNKIKYRPISNSELSHILPVEYGKVDGSVVGRILSKLMDNGLIDSGYYPKFLLGSTRLAAVSYYGPEFIETDEYETDDVIQSALGEKELFGDLDLDVKFSAGIKEITDFINSDEELQGRVAAKASFGSDEVNLAVRMDDNSVIQVDIVNVSKSGISALKFMQYSSFVDLSENIKGVFATMLLRSVANIKKTEFEDFSHFEDFVENNPEEDFSKTWKKITGPGRGGDYTPARARYVVSPSHLKLAVEFEKQGIKTIKKLFYPEFRKDYSDLDSLAEFLLGEGARGAMLFHATTLADYIKQNFSPDDIEKITESFLHYLERDVRKGLDPEKYEIGKNSILSRLQGDELQENKTITEGRVGIGRFVGPSKLSNKAAYEILYTLAEITGNQGKDRFEVDFLNDPDKVDVVEKMDSNYLAFGLDRNGEFYIESSTSGLVYPSVYKKRFSFSEDHLKSYESILNNKNLQKSLREVFDEHGAFKFNAELFPVLTHEENEKGEVIFVGTPYSKDKFGTQGGLVIFNAKLWDQDRHRWFFPPSRKNSQIVSQFKKLSKKTGFAKEWKIYSNDADMKLSGTLMVDLKGLGQFFTSREKLAELIPLLRKKEYRLIFNEIRENLQIQLNQVADDAVPNLGNRDSYIEGVVLRVKKPDGDFYEIKGTSERFDVNKKKYFEDRTNIQEVEARFKKTLLIDILGLPESVSKSSISIKKHLKDPIKGKYLPKALEDEVALDKRSLIKFLRSFGDKEEGSLFQFVSALDAKDKISKLVRNTNQELFQIHSSIKQKSENGELDKNTIRKSFEWLNNFIKKINSYEELLNMPLESEEDKENFINDLFYKILEVDISKILNIENAYDYEPDVGEYEKVIVFVGRFQPFHKGHKAAVRQAKEGLEEVDGDKVLIFVIEGNESSLDNAKNPLSGGERVRLIDSLYRDDPRVEVSKNTLPDVRPNTLLTSLYDKKLKFVGIAAGDEGEKIKDKRLTQYKNAVQQFSPSKWKSDHEYTPIDKDERGHFKFKFIDARRLFSGTKARERAMELEFDEWLAEIADINISDESRKIYKQMYDNMKGPELSLSEPPVEEPLEEKKTIILLSSLVEEILQEKYIKRPCKKKKKTESGKRESGNCAVVSHTTNKQKACYDKCSTAAAVMHEEELEEISTCGGGPPAPSGTNGSIEGVSGPYKPLKLRRRKKKASEKKKNESLVQEVLNYLMKSSIMETQK